jgi:predicted amidohydrolase
MKPDDIIAYSDIVHDEKAALQKGMNFDIGKGYSVFLMSVRKGAPIPRRKGRK